MPVDIEDLLALLGQLCDDEGIRIAVKETVKGGLLTGAAAMVGGLLLGPPGLGLGEYHKHTLADLKRASKCTWFMVECVALICHSEKDLGPFCINCSQSRSYPLVNRFFL